jgi:formate dehydrogenase subunit delta
MNPDTLIRMANDIGAFFAGDANPDEAAQHVLLHIRRYWDPRMKAQIIKHYEAGGAGLDDHVRAAIKLLTEQ